MRSGLLGCVFCVVLTSACGGEEEVLQRCEITEATSCPSGCGSISGMHLDVQRNCFIYEVIACQEMPEVPIVSNMMKCFIRRPSDGERFLLGCEHRPVGWAIDEMPENFDWSTIEECPTPIE